MRVLVVHGIGCSRPGYSSGLQDSIAARLGFSSDPVAMLWRLPGREDTIPETSWTRPEDTSCQVPEETAALLVRSYEQRGRLLEFFELTWSPIAYRFKSDAIGWDLAKTPSHANRLVKDSLIFRFADTIAYTGRGRQDVQAAVLEVLCRMWQPRTMRTAAGPCSFDGAAESVWHEHIAASEYAMIGHSLGSRIVFDTLRSIGWDPAGQMVRSEFPELRHAELARLRARRSLVPSMLQRLRGAYLLSSQLPLLELAEIPVSEPPSVEAALREKAELTVALERIIQAVDESPGEVELHGLPAAQAAFEAGIESIEQILYAFDDEMQREDAIREESRLDAEIERLSLELERHRENFQAATDSRDAAQAVAIEAARRADDAADALARSEERERLARERLSDAKLELSVSERSSDQLVSDRGKIEEERQRQNRSVLEARGQVTEAEREVESARRELVAAEQRARAARSKLNAAIREQESADEDLERELEKEGAPEDDEKRLTFLGELLNMAVQRFKDLYARVERANDTVRESEANVDARDREVEEAAAEVQRRRQLLEAERAAREQLEAELRSLDRELAAIDRELQIRQAGVSAGEDEVDDSRRRVAQAQSEFDRESSARATAEDAYKAAVSQAGKTYRARIRTEHERADAMLRRKAQRVLRLEAEIRIAASPSLGLRGFNLLLELAERQRTLRRLRALAEDPGADPASEIKQIRLEYEERRLPIVAIHDPNDFLTYYIPEAFALEHPRLDVANAVTRNVMNWYLLADPLQVHTKYFENDWVIQLLACGAGSTGDIEQACHALSVDPENRLLRPLREIDAELATTERDEGRER